MTRRAWWGWHLLLLTAALLTSLSRIYLAKHYPSQVIAGMFLGINIGVTASLLYRVKIWLEPLITKIENFARLAPWQDVPPTSLASKVKNQLIHEASSHA
jgi:membrane-associated phospholipid phosphatase